MQGRVLPMRPCYLPHDKMKIDTLYVSDLDGTLLGTDSLVSERSAQIISGLSERGALITVATARTPATVVPLLAATKTAIPAIVMTGDAFWDRRAGRLTHTHFVPGADVLAALDFCRHHAVHPFVYVMAADGRTLDVYHAAPALNKAERSFYDERCRLPLKRFHLGTPAPARALSHTMLLYAMGDAKGIVAAYEAFRQATECSVFAYPDIFNPEIYNLEVFPPGVSKATAIELLKAELGARRLVVFGDNLNDLPMLAAADVAVAVDNAFPEVKEHADVVIGPNYADSVANYILQDFTRQ